MPPWEFCWKITLEGLLVSVPILFVLLLLFGMPEALEESSTLRLEDLFSAALFAPIVETLLLQALPIGIVRLFKGSFKIQVIVSTIVFAAPHFLLDWATGIGAGVVGGFYSAFTYSYWRNISRGKAFWVTTASHGLHNASLILLSLLLEKLFYFS